MFYYFQMFIRRLLLAVDRQQKPNLPRKVRKLNVPLVAFSLCTSLLRVFHACLARTLKHGGSCLKNVKNGGPRSSKTLFHQNICRLISGTEKCRKRSNRRILNLFVSMHALQYAFKESPPIYKLALLLNDYGNNPVFVSDSRFFTLYHPLVKFYNNFTASSILGERS